MYFQKTIAGIVTLEGVGLHSGVKSVVTIKPAIANTGIVFVRIDLPGAPRIDVNSDNAVEGVNRCTVLESNGARVSTIEHLLAALSGLGIDNAIIEINNEEVPGMDGSSKDFVDAFLKVGINQLKAAKKVVYIKQPITLEINGASITIEPSDKFEINYTLDYDHPLLRNQQYTIDVSEESFKGQIASARTFCLEREVAQIKANGLGKGATEQNTLVVGDKGPINNKFRFPDECARHKALDIVGDFSLLGASICGKIKAVKSGHALNRQMVKKIMEQTMTEQKVYDINDIMKILPHRYPFLLVDRVIEIERGKKGVGIKNVTINDGFFQGHFPQRPVMPGVLMLEAMAQAAGVIVLTSGVHNNKVALFMAIDQVKFRRVVSPGDQLMMEIEVIRDRERTAQVQCVGKVDGETVVEAEMIFSYTDDSYLNGS